MSRKLIFALVLLAGLFMAAPLKASAAIVETQHLIVSDANDTLSNDQLKRLADEVQEMLERVLVFWSADSGIAHFGKIKVIFDTLRRGITYSSVFYWDKSDSRPMRVVRVFGYERSPQMMAHKLTSALFPQKDKLIRNMMGIPTEAKIGNPLTFPGCGFSSDDWVLVFLKTKSFLPLNEIGPDHESWGMSATEGGNLSVFDRVKQSKAYAEAGSFGNYLILTYGVNKMKQFHILSSRKERPWKDVFGITLQELEINWLKTLQAEEKTRYENTSVLTKLFERNPNAACLMAQKLVSEEQQQ